MQEGRIHFSQSFLESFCKRNHIKKLSFFGSVLRNDFRDNSDIDILVEFEAGKTPGWKIIQMEKELSRTLDRNVDLRTPQEISRFSRDRVLAESQIAYVSH
jgi:uncharacterized protein